MPGQNEAESPDAQTMSARLALRMAAGLREDPDFAVEYAEEFSSVAAVFKVLEGIKNRVDMAPVDQKALEGLLERCIYVTSCVVVKCTRTFVFMDVDPLVECLEETEMFARKSRRRERDFTEQHRRLNELTSDMDLSEMIEFESKTEGLLQALVSGEYLKNLMNISWRTCGISESLYMGDSVPLLPRLRGSTWGSRARTIHAVDFLGGILIPGSIHPLSPCFIVFSDICCPHDL